MKTCSHAMRVFLIASILVSATALLLLLSSPPAQADGVVYVSNMGVSDGQSVGVTSTSAQAFQTGGASTDTFALGSIELNISELLANFDVDGVQVRLYSSTASSGPNAEICTLSNPSDLDTTGVKRFETVAACSSLAGDATYFVVMDYTSTGLGYKLQYANSGSENSGPEAGWTINDKYWFIISGGTWTQSSASQVDVIKISVRAVNAAPTASDGTVDTYEGTAYTFKAGDFRFDSNGDPDALDQVKITSLPGTGKGTLWLDSDDDDQLDAGEAVAVDGQVAAGDIDGGNLQYTPPASGTGKAFTSFDFKVNDGFDESTSAFTMSINVSVELVSNTGQDRNTGWTLSTRVNARAQAFTTGSNPKGYDLGSFTLDLEDFQADAGNSTTTVSLYSSTSTDLANPGNPKTESCTLVNPDEQGAGIYTFAAPPANCGTMVKATEYFVVVHTVVIDTNQPHFDVNWHVTASDSEDGTPSPGWSIRNGSHKKNGNWAVILLDDAFKMKVNGAAIPNARPMGASDAVSTDEDTTYIFSEADFILSDDDNDGTPSDDTLHVVVTSLPGAGKGTLWLDVDGDDAIGTGEAVAVNNSVAAADLAKLKYTPPANEYGSAFTTFKFKVNDGYEDSDSEYTVTVNVTAVNDAPVVTGLDAITVAENTADDTILATYTATDVEGDTLTWTLRETESGIDDSNEFSVVYGRLYFASERNYEDPKDTDGNNVYEVRVIAYDDDDGGLDVAVTVTDVNEAPVAVDDTYSTNQGTAVVIPVSNAALEGVLDNDTDEDGDTLGVTEVTDPPNGAAALAVDKTTTTYMPDTDFAGFDSFTYTVADGSGDDALTDTGTVTVSVTPKVSRIEPPGSGQIVYEENGTGSVATYTAVGSPTWQLKGDDSGDFSIDSGGGLTFNSPPDFESPADADGLNDYAVTVVATVRSGGSTVSAPLDVTVTVTNVSDSTQVDYAENGTGAVATYSASGSPTWSLSGTDNGAFSISGGVLSFKSPPDFESPADGTEGNRDNVYEVTVETDDNGEVVVLDVSVTVTDLPAVSGPAVAEYAENGTVAVATYSATDANGDDVAVTWSLSGTDSGTLSISANRELTFNDTTFPKGPDFETPADGTEGNRDNVYQVTVEADDGTEVGKLDVTVTVVDVNDDVLTVADDAAVTDEDTAVDIAVSDNDRLAAGSGGDVALSVSDEGSAGNGGLVLNSDTNVITYTPDAHFNGTDSFTYTATDGTNTATGRVTVTVRAVNDAPAAVDDNVVTVEGTAIVIDVVANDTDLDGDALSVVSVGDATRGNAALTDRSSTEITYTPNAGSDFTASFDYTVTDGTTTATATVTVKVERAAVTVEELVVLSGLTVTSGTGGEPLELNPAFAAYTTAYTLNVPNSVSSLQVTPKKKYDTSDEDDPDTADNVVVNIRVNGKEVGSDSSIPVRAGGVTTNEIDVIALVSWAEGVVDEASETYSIRVTRAPGARSSNANLEALTVSGGALDVDFDSGITDYTMTVSNSVASIALNLRAAHGRATVVVTANGVEAPADNIPLTEGGTTVIAVVVTAQDGSTSKTYTITVTRAPSANADLAGLTVSGGALDTDFDSGITDYSMTVANSVASIALDPRVAHGSATVAVKANGVDAPADNIPLTEGGTTVITVVVTAQDGTTTRTYTIRVTRAPSANADLAGLTVSEGSLDTDFEPGITSYSMTVANSVSSVSVFPRAANANATVSVKVNGVEAPADNIPLTEGGTTVITLLVTAQDGTTTRTYTIRVTRVPSSLSANLDLAGLTISGGSLNIDFEPGITSYSVAVANSVSSVSVFPRAANADATVSVKVNGVEAPADNIPLTEGGTTVINVVVTAQDGSTSKTYTITVFRAARVSVGRRGGGSGGRVSRILIPSFVEGSQTIRSVAENTPGGANIGAPIVATDPTDDRLTYSLLGGDAAQFGIDAASGRLLTNGPLDFESKSGYRVSVSVSNSRGGRDTIAVTINLTNVDEPGTVAVLPAQLAVGRAMTAVLTDPDGGVNGITWQWAVSSDQVVWRDIAGATLDTYSPMADDGGKYLRATAFYTDGEGTGKSAQATWDTPLVPPAAPETTLTPTPAAVAPSPEPTRAASPTTVASSAVTPPTTPSAVPSAAVVPTPAPAAGVPATSALEQAADDSGIDLWVILLIAAVVVAAAAGLIILGVRIIRA